MEAAAAGVFGRETEFESVRRLLEGTGNPAALVIEGEAGIGKTTLWRAGIELATKSSWRVLSCRPTVSEAGLSFTAVADLLEPVAREALPLLPPPQRQALAAALLIEGPADAHPSSRAVGAAVLNVLMATAAEERVLLAIDDSQWLDPASVAALAYAVRRLPPERVALLETLRVPHAEPLELNTRRPMLVVEQLEVGPLDMDALHAVVRARLEVRVPRPTMFRVHEVSGGNPFYAVELVRSLPRVDGSVAAHDVPLPRSLHALVDDRLAAFEQPVQETLSAAASLASPTISVLERVIPGASSMLAVAERHGVVEIQDERIEFSHPLLAGAALELLPTTERAQLHRRIAEALTEPEERARHLALGTLAPDEQVASEVEHAAAVAARRGGTRTAAELAEQAVRLTPPEHVDDSRRRTREAARYHLAAGNEDHADSLLAALRDELPPGPERARVLVQMAPTSTGGTTALMRLCEAAVDEAGGDAECLVEAHRWLSQAWMHHGDLDQALSYAREAAHKAEVLGDPVRLVQCLGTLSHFETYTGQITPGLLERAVALEQETPGTSPHYSPAQILGLRYAYSDRLDEGRDLLERALVTAESEGEEPDRAIILAHLTQLEVAAGNWSRADSYASLHFELGAQLGHSTSTMYFPRALVYARVGRVDETRALLLDNAEKTLGEPDTTHFRHILNRWVLGFLELSLENAPRAAALMGALPETLERIGYRNPGVRPILPDAVEALVGVGELERAQRWAETLTERGRELDNAWARATGKRCLGLVAAAEGRMEDALVQFEEALVEHERSQNPFERGRTLLALGVVLRRSKRRSEARERLTAALDVFDHLGAALWSERAAAEIARIPGRTKASSELTETERRVAELVADGLSNKEVAAQLFITVRTVEANLTKVYAKLGIRSRTELVSRLRS